MGVIPSRGGLCLCQIRKGWHPSKDTRKAKHPRIPIASRPRRPMLLPCNGLADRQEMQNKHHLNMSETYKLAVRESLRETAFRRYERFIGDATKGSLVVDPKMQVPAMKSSSFKVGVREAIAGKIRFNYNSSFIPPDYDLRKIVVRELEDGKIWLHNEHQDTLNKRVIVNDEIPATLVVDSDGNLAAKNQKAEIESKNVRHMPTLERELLEGWCKELDADKTLRSQIAWLVRATQPEEIAFFRELQMKYEGVDFEKLNFGWWRVGR